MTKMSTKSIVTNFQHHQKHISDNVFKCAVGMEYEIYYNDSDVNAGYKITYNNDSTQKVLDEVPEEVPEEVSDESGLLRSDAWTPYMVEGRSVTPEEFDKLSQPIRAAFLGFIERRRRKSKEYQKRRNRDVRNDLKSIHRIKAAVLGYLVRKTSRT